MATSRFQPVRCSMGGPPEVIFDPEPPPVRGCFAASCFTIRDHANCYCLPRLPEETCSLDEIGTFSHGRSRRQIKFPLGYLRVNHESMVFEVYDWRRVILWGGFPIGMTSATLARRFSLSFVHEAGNLMVRHMQSSHLCFAMSYHLVPPY
ncbi:hypothetical protein LZ30DRAFT_714019 [Colletotrichum cereale]|nr:hypothetical protein LZ30DRAFT_714019 [Colletotrichum cereale]